MSTAVHGVGPTEQALLAGLIDYAGLFPPASLDMAAVVANYDRYRRGRFAWMLGRLVVPASRLAELGDMVGRLGDGADGWRINALVDSLDEALPAIDTFNRLHGGRGGQAIVDAIDVKASSTAAIDTVASRVPGEWRRAYELPVDHASRDLLQTVRDSGGLAKVRLGGVVETAIPAVRDLARFLLTAAQVEVPFKATAGLHHPIRGMYSLTYASDSARAAMHGFVNVFVASVIASALVADAASDGEALGVLTSVLEDSAPDAFMSSETGLSWRGRGLTPAQLASARRAFALSFGSCSFDEPIHDLRALGWAI